MPAARGFVFAERLAAERDLLTNATLAIKIEAILARATNSKFRERQRFFTARTSLKIQYRCFCCLRHHPRSEINFLKHYPDRDLSAGKPARAPVRSKSFRLNVGDELLVSLLTSPSIAAEDFITAVALTRFTHLREAKRVEDGRVMADGACEG
jgi:hypothetical protein